MILLIRLSEFLVTHCKQFGLKPKLGTDHMCIYYLKQIICSYSQLNGGVCTCFLDAAKAFDRVKQSALFRKLLRRGAPGYIVRLLMFWYARQSMCVRWGGSVSAKFNVSNWSEARRYPVAISIQYIHQRSQSRSEQVLYSLYSWEDRFVIFSPSEKGFSLLLDVCEKYGIIIQRKVLFLFSQFVC